MLIRHFFDRRFENLLDTISTIKQISKGPLDAVKIEATFCILKIVNNVENLSTFIDARTRNSRTWSYLYNIEKMHLCVVWTWWDRERCTREDRQWEPIWTNKEETFVFRGNREKEILSSLWFLIKMTEKHHKNVNNVDSRPANKFADRKVRFSLCPERHKT